MVGDQFRVGVRVGVAIKKKDQSSGISASRVFT